MTSPHLLPVEAILADLRSSSRGLSAAEAAARSQGVAG